MGELRMASSARKERSRSSAAAGDRGGASSSAPAGAEAAAKRRRGESLFGEAEKAQRPRGRSLLNHYAAASSATPTPQGDEQSKRARSMAL